MTNPETRFERKLPVHLTDREVDAKAREVAEKVSALERLKFDHKAVKASLKRKEDELAAEIATLAEVVEQRAEERPVPCKSYPNLRAAEQVTVRLDTYETIERRTLSASELDEVRQEVLPFEEVNDATSKEPDNAPAKESEPQDFSVTCDLLELVDVRVAPEIVAGWTPEERQRAEEWAGAATLAASDNDVRVPPEPECVALARLAASQADPDPEAEARAQAEEAAKPRRKKAGTGRGRRKKATKKS